jgi:aspartyl-tRNA(Asn)/glutamyl-tRNA(Gln) amidotransferase subunit A
LVQQNFIEYFTGYHTKNIDSKDTYEEILTKTRDESLGERVRGRILAGNYYLLEESVFFYPISIILFLFHRNYDKYFVQSQRVRRAVVNDYKKVFEEDKVDCLLAPVVSDDPVTLADYERSDDIFSEDDIFTVGANLAGMSNI